VESIVAKIARIPPKKVSVSDTEALRNLDRDLKMVVYGQDAAIEALASAIRMNRSGLGHEEKPIGSFLFTGPTGVGKTEVTRQLARILGMELIRFDMSEYMERHTVSRLIGAPPGYVGFDQGGLLTEEINKHPHAVLLLDEIEKAHPDVFNLLLQVMDHGTLTDNNGRKADFRNVVLVMTTNAGAEETAGAPSASPSRTTPRTGWRPSSATSPQSSGTAWTPWCSSPPWARDHQERGGQVHLRAGAAARGQEGGADGGCRRPGLDRAEGL
jgi:ATP-dependent Clp protease ATP-binding subunit ClpA